MDAIATLYDSALFTVLCQVLTCEPYTVPELSSPKYDPPFEAEAYIIAKNKGWGLHL